ncbi:MAG: ribonuclease P protein component [Oscillospiraceae bacterium]|nr:ribonuclease P protein component [Oscillospiraceae bacterium]
MKLHPINQNHLFGKVYSGGKKHYATTVSVHCLRDKHSGRLRKAHPEKLLINRIGITVTKKIGNAPTRNRVKRIIREAYRQLDAEYSIRRGMLIVISAREGATTAKTADVTRDLLRGLKKLELIGDRQEAGAE